jgi:hypothetical protein
MFEMSSGKAIWLSRVLKEVENVDVDWRALKKFSDDYDENQTLKLKLKRVL